MGSKILTLTICMFLFSLTFISAQTELKDTSLSEVSVTLKQCIDSLGKIAKCESIPLKDKSKYTELPETSKLIIKEDGMYLDNLRIKAEKDASVYIAEKKGTTYHVDNLNKEKVSAYLEFQYDIQPDYITHIDKYNNKVNTYFPLDWTWTPNCVGSGEEAICNGGIVRVYVTDLTEESIGSETFPIGITGPTWARDGYFAGEFNGVNSYVSLLNKTEFDFSLTNVSSYSIWFNSDIATATDQDLFFFGGRIELNLDVSETQIKFLWSDSGGNLRSFSCSGTCYEYNHWYNLIIVANYSNITQMYLDGINIRNGTSNYGVKPNLGINYIGTSESNSRPFSGSIDNVQIFNKTLNQSEITQLYDNGRINSPCSLITDGQVLCIDFDDSSVADKSGLGNHGTNTNVTYTPIQLFYNSLVNGVDYSLDTKTGLFTILNPNYVYSWMSASWEFYQTGRLTDANHILGNVSNGLTGWFNAINPAYTILSVLVIILVLIILVRVVSNKNKQQEIQL